jgi:hypothetical protein
MANAALFVGWGVPVAGREQQALQIFGETVAYWTRLQQEGAIESFEPFLLEPHGGELSGFCVLRGEAERLAQVRVSEDFQRLNARAQLVATNYGVVGAVTGEALQQTLAQFGQHATELA